MNGNRIPKSEFINGIKWRGERLSYPEPHIKGDTYPMTWADDDNIYVSAGDPAWGETTDGLDIEKFEGGPEDYKISKVNHMNDYRGGAGAGAKPSGMICVDGILYLAFQNLLGMKLPAFGDASQNGCDSVIVSSSHMGRYWNPAYENIAEPTFPGFEFGGPAFINFGKNNENARDGYVYAVSADQWDNGSNMRLGRVPNDKIARKEEWEWVCAFDMAGQPVWNRNLRASIPVLSMHRHMSLPEMVYLAGINRYLLLTWRLRKDFSCNHGSDLIILEAPEPWGPFSMVYYEELWEGELGPYCPRLPLKWVEADGKTCWMQFSGRWGRIGHESGYYRSHVRKFELLMK